MSSYINLFLKTELTVLPHLLDKYVGTYYNNALCNGITWMFLSWCLLRLAFQAIFRNLLRKMKVGAYVTERLVLSLWHLGFYTAALSYCTATLWRSNLGLLNFRQLYDPPQTGDFFFGFIVLVTFFLQCIFWEPRFNLGYLALFLFFSLAYFSRFLAGSFRLTILLSTFQISLEFTRSILTIFNGDSNVVKWVLYMICLTIFTTVHLFLIPLLIWWPLIQVSTMKSTVLTTLLTLWVLHEIYASIVSKGLCHVLKHKQCEENFLNCSFFPKRTDVAYNLSIIAKEIKDRHEESLSLRRPKNRTMMMQTLKCMVAIKKKLKEKRQTKEEQKSKTD